VTPFKFMKKLYWS